MLGPSSFHGLTTAGDSQSVPRCNVVPTLPVSSELLSQFQDVTSSYGIKQVKKRMKKMGLYNRLDIGTGIKTIVNPILPFFSIQVLSSAFTYTVNITFGRGV